MGTSDTLLEWQEPAGGGVADAAAADGRHAAAVPGDAGGRQVRRRDARDVCGGAGVHARRGALLLSCFSRAFLVDVYLAQYVYIYK